MLDQIKKELENLGDSERAKKLSGFFKTGKGQYGEGDVFLGIPVPLQRKVAKKYIRLSLEDLQRLLRSKIHEYRLTALLILVLQYSKTDFKGKERIFSFYLENSNFVNNWDLVDLTAPKIIGDYLLDKDKKILYTLVKSSCLWERRIAILATFTFIRNDDFNDALQISKILLFDKHDLIHKAVGWMLREIGKRNKRVLEEFLEKYCIQMPRTMLRYSIEKFDKEKRKYYLGRKNS
ncbi:DNA alkylation repair protein [Candidatus Bathyarchaeota archaeon]|nr:DNA alkylation repair protein [Candidatus Bathyarchaeota archaeon]